MIVGKNFEWVFDETIIRTEFLFLLLKLCEQFKAKPKLNGFDMTLVQGYSF
jgi:hypothetical protein